MIDPGCLVVPIAPILHNDRGFAAAAAGTSHHRRVALGAL